MTFDSNASTQAAAAMHEKKQRRIKAIIDYVSGVSYKPLLSRFDLAWKHFEDARRGFVLHFSY